MDVLVKTAGENALAQERSRDRLTRYAIYLGLAVLTVYSFFHLNMPLERLPDGLREMGSMIAFRMFPPELTYAPSLVTPFLETFAMAFVGTMFGIVLAVPLAWLASANMTPSLYIAYPLARAILIVTRSVHEVIWALVLVALFGFGPLAGMIVLTLHFIGFAGKLLAENIEVADMRPVESIRAAGGNRLKQMVLGVYPQVRPVWIGIFVYGWDIVLRASFILGMVGAGGVGAQLRGSIESLRYDRVGMILIIIFIIVAAGEILSMKIRKRIT
jgi:phosphonate transport system permease protein